MSTDTVSVKPPERQTRLQKLLENRLARVGLVSIALLLIVAVSAPLLANGRPFIIYQHGFLRSPALYFLFAPDSNEFVIAKFFNFVLLFAPVGGTIAYLTANRPKLMGATLLITAIALLIPFVTCKPVLDKTNWRSVSETLTDNDFALFAPVPYGPNEAVSAPYQKPSYQHLMGTDNIGRDILARMIYGSRMSLAVGLFASVLTLVIGTIIGMSAGFFGGKTDIVIMRIVEIIICLPMFLLLLILMVIMLERKYQQSALVVIFIIGITGWTGLCRLVRGETLKIRKLPYIENCIVQGIPVWRIMRYHLLPNIAGIILVNFTFSIAGAILIESTLSFLGFGVQAPTPSWGELLRQAFENPQAYWNLVLWPGLALFITITAFNFAGEGLRNVYSPQN